MEPSLILFDIDGTLVDTAGAGRRAMLAAFREVFDVDALERVSREVRFAGMSDMKIVETLVRAAGLDHSEESLERVRRSYLEALGQEMAQPDSTRRVLPGVQELLDHLETRDEAYLGLLTGNMEPGARTKLEPFDLNRFFPAGGFGSDHADRREIVRMALEKSTRHFGREFPPSRVSVIGDTELDVDCAKANGFRSIAVEFGWTRREVLVAAEPDALFPDLCDLPAVLEAMGLENGQLS